MKFTVHDPSTTRGRTTLTPELVAMVRRAAQQHEPRLHEVADVLEALVASPTAQPECSVCGPLLHTSPVCSAAPHIVHTAQPDGESDGESDDKAPRGYEVSEDVNLACLDECLDIVGHAVDETYSPKVMGLMLGALALLGSAKEEYLRPTAAARPASGEREEVREALVAAFDHAPSSTLAYLAVALRCGQTVDPTKLADALLTAHPGAADAE